jgi:hypothetical protein
VLIGYLILVGLKFSQVPINFFIILDSTLKKLVFSYFRVSCIPIFNPRPHRLTAAAGTGLARTYKVG